MKKALVPLLVIMTIFLIACKPGLEEQFRNPPNEYKPMPFWHINGEMTTEGIWQQMRDAKELAGFTGVSELYPEHTMKRLDKLEKEVRGPVTYTDSIPEGRLMAAVAMNMATLERTELSGIIEENVYRSQGYRNSNNHQERSIIHCNNH